MKVLAISYGKNFFEPGNSERNRMAVCAEKAGELHAVVFSHVKEGLNKELIRSNFTAYPTNSKNNFTKVTDAIRIGKKIINSSNEKNDWVITAQDPFEAGLVAWQIAKATGVSFNIQEHGDFFSTKFWARESILNRCRAMFGKFLLKKADSVRVVSKRIKKTLEGLGVRTEKIFILSVRTGVSRFSTAAANPKCIPNFDSNNKYILTVARFVPQKNLSFLIRTFSNVQIDHPEAHLLIVGQGKDESALKALATKILPEYSYTFMPWSENVPVLMAIAHVYALSSNYEGWGRVLIEAQAAGMPIVTTDVGCVGEEVTESEACKVVPVNDEKRFVKALGEMLRNYEMTKQTARIIKSEFDYNITTNTDYAKKWVEILKRTRNSKL